MFLYLMQTAVLLTCLLNVLPSDETLRLAAERAMDEVKNAGGRFLEWQSLAFHVNVKDSIVLDRLSQVLQAIVSMKMSNVFDEETALKSLGATTETGPEESTTKTQSPTTTLSQVTHESSENNHNIKEKASDTAVEEEVMNSSEKVESVEIGSRICVYWPLDQRSYVATVLDKDGNLAHLQYLEDGLTEWIDLTKHWFDIMEEGAAGPPGDTPEEAETNEFDEGADGSATQESPYEVE